MCIRDSVQRIRFMGRSSHPHRRGSDDGSARILPSTRPRNGRRAAPASRHPMDRTDILGEWKELKRTIKQQWSKLTDEDLARLDANLAAFTDVLQQRYGIS